MEHISRLRSLLYEALGGNARQSTQQELFEELMVQKHGLTNVLDVGGRNVQEQKEIESGKAIINGKSLSVNVEFSKQVLFLSQQLECSERYVAGLLHTVMTQNPNIGAVSCIELAVSTFHERRRHMADSLRFLLLATDAAESSDASQTFQRIEHFVRNDLLLQKGADSSIAWRVFTEIQNLNNVLGRADTAMRSAKTNTIAPSGQEQPSLGLGIMTARCESLKYERRTLALSLFLFARLGFFSPQEVKGIVDWLSQNPNHALTYYLLASILTAFDTVDPETLGGRSRTRLASDATVVSYVSKKLERVADWKDLGMRSIILVKWTLFLTEFRHRNPTIENREGFRTDELESQIRNAVQGDAFTYASLAILQIHRQSNTFRTPSLLTTLAPSTEQLELREVPDEEFQPVLLRAFEIIVRSLITHASSELRKIKQRQEDIVLAGASDRTRHNTRFFSNTTQESDKPPRNDIAILYSFIGLLYQYLPKESALQFWGAGPQVEATRSTYMEFIESTAGRLPSFLQWAVWSTQAQDITGSTALYDMLAGLSTGQQCSELTYNFLARGGNEVIPGSSLPPTTPGLVSWEVIFGLLENWAAGSSNARPAPSQSNNQAGWGQPQSQLPPQNSQVAQIIGPKDVLFAQAFLRLLANVVTHSIVVRQAVSSNAQFRAIPTLVSLIPLGIPLELKGAIFETLSAFCQPGGGSAGVEICGAVWTLMERLEVINVRGGATLGLGTPVKGVEVELEEIEAVHGLYPATIPFLRLLATLIHTPKRIPLRDRIADATPLNTIPESLGQPYRLPGIGPFASFVMDNVFSKIHAREYLRQSNRWEMNDLSLAFIERCLASFDLESLLAAAERSEIKLDVLRPLLVHPGYEVIKRLLTSSPLQRTLLSYIVEGVDGFDKGIATEEPWFHSTIVRVLRIVHRVLEIQDIFLDILIPVLSDFNSSPFVGTVHQQSHFTRFDKALSFNPQYAAAIATYVTFVSHSELVLISIKILTSLSLSTSFSNLGSLIERSNDSERILAGFIDILSSDSGDDIAAAETLADQSTGAGAEAISFAIPLTQATRLAALELLTQNTLPHRSFPNIAHFLLFGASSDHQIQDPHALGAGLTCVHVLLQLLNAGVPQKARGPANGVPLFVGLPALAERCYRIIYNLCVHPSTSETTMRYLRTRENFFLRHLSAIPIQVPETLQEPYIQVQYTDGSRVVTTVSALCSFLKARSWVLDLAALEMHVLTNKGGQKGAAGFLEALFGREETAAEESTWEDDILRPFTEIGQSHVRILELVASLAFDWTDNLSLPSVELQLLGQLNIHSCVRRDNWGCEIIDRAALVSLLTSARAAHHAQNSVLTQTFAEQLNAETAYILESCAIENHRRQIAQATAKGFEAWRHLLDITLDKCFDKLAENGREGILFDLLHILPPIIRSPDLEVSTTVLISEVILSSITNLRKDRQQQGLLKSSSPLADLPAERLCGILRSIFECILGANEVELVRGNLYAALVNFIHLIASDPDPSPSGHLASSTALVHVTPLAQDHKSSLRLQSLSLLKSVMDRLVTTVCRDAIDGTEVWKTISFILLDSLTWLSGLERQHPLLTVLVRQGILNNLVHGVRESDLLLQSVLKPDPDDLNPLYVYEAKMSLFIQLGQTRIGAERLLDSQLILGLAQCDYLDARPEADRSFMDDSFLPSAIQRYHQIFMPALQVLNTILCTLGSKHSTAASQALEFLASHSSTIVILLRNDSDNTSLSVLEELHLLVSLCTTVLPLVPQADLIAANSGFGAIHSAILNLATRCIGDAGWAGEIVPQTASEVAKASARDSAFSHESVFDTTSQRLERRLRRALLAYLGGASDFQSDETNVVLSPLIISPKQDSQFLATIPSIGDALVALQHLSEDLSHTLRRMQEIAAELRTPDHISADGVAQIVDALDPAIVQKLNRQQKQTLAISELEAFASTLDAAARVLLQSIEMLLLLLWRHVIYYASIQQDRPSKANLSGSTAQAMRFLSTPDPQTFRLEVGKRVRPILERVKSFDLGTDPRWADNVEYLDIMCRRLKDALGVYSDRSMDST